MTLDLVAALAVILAGALHATWNTLVKVGGDGTATLVLIMFGGGVVWLPVALAVPLPAPASLPYLVASMTIHMVYAALLLGAYRHGDLSQVYPIARGSAPALVAAGAWLLAGEALGTLEWLGVAVVSLGIVSLARVRARVRADRMAAALALATGVTIAGYIVVDGMGVRRSGSPFGYIAWLFVGEGALMALVGWWLRRARLCATLRTYWSRGLAGGALASASYGIAVWAMSLGPMAHVTALRETSVLIAALIGTRLLGEPFGTRRVAAAAAVAAGAVIIQVGGAT